MSFGAVAALSAFVPALQWGRIERRSANMVESALQFAARHAAGLVSTTLVASIATAPFGAYHFQTLNPYGLVGNALALPLVSLVVMPSAVLGVLAYPFGLDQPVWRMMGAAVSQVLDVSAWVGGFAGSSVVIPALGLGALALFSLALLIASIAASSLRWLALVPALAGLALAASPDRPDVYIDRAGQGAAIRNAAGRLTFVGKASAFVAEQWLRADGDGRDAVVATAAETRLKDGARCDPQGCVVETANRRHIAFVQKFTAFEEDCRRAEIVISSLKAPPGCAALVVLDREALAARGATTIRLDAHGMHIRSVRKGDERLSRVPSPSRPAEMVAKPASAIPEQDIPADETDGDGSERGPSDDFSSAAPD
jgi:competence protein ComEC